MAAASAWNEHNYKRALTR